MAVVQTSGVVGEVRGLLGDVVFSRNRGGAYVRTRGGPPGPLTPRRARYRANFSAVSTLWASLTQSERDSWFELCDDRSSTRYLGRARSLSAFNWFMRVNLGLVDNGLDVLRLAPPSLHCPGVPRFGVTQGLLDSGDILLILEFENGLDLGELFEVWATPVYQPGKKWLSDVRRRIATVGYPFQPAYQVGRFWADVFGALPTGTGLITFWVNVINAGNGQRSPRIRRTTFYTGPVIGQWTYQDYTPVRYQSGDVATFNS